MDTALMLKPVATQEAMASPSSTSCSLVSSDNLYCTGTSNDSSAQQSPVSTPSCGEEARVFGAACTAGMVSPSSVPFIWEEAPGKPALDSWKKQNSVHLQLPPKMTAHQQQNANNGENQHGQQQKHHKLHKLQSQKLVKACKSMVRASSWISPTSLQLLRCHRSTGSFSTTGQFAVVRGCEDGHDDVDHDSVEAGQQEHSRLSFIAARNQKLMKLCKSMLRISLWSNPIRSLQYHSKQNPSVREKTTTAFQGIRHYVWAKKLRCKENQDKQADVEICPDDMNIHQRKLLQGVNNDRFFFDKAGPHLGTKSRINPLQYDEVSESDDYDDFGDHGSYARWKSIEAERLVQQTAHLDGSPQSIHGKQTIDSSLVQGMNGGKPLQVNGKHPSKSSLIHGTHANESMAIQGRQVHEPSPVIGTYAAESSPDCQRLAVGTSVVHGRFIGSDSSPSHEKHVDDPLPLQCITEHHNMEFHLPIQPELQDRVDKWLSSTMVYYSFQDLTEGNITHSKSIPLSDLSEGEEEEGEEEEEKYVRKRSYQIPVAVKKLDPSQVEPASGSEMRKINTQQPLAIDQPLQNNLKDEICLSPVHINLGDAIKFDETPPHSPQSWERSLELQNGPGETSQSVSEDSEISDQCQSFTNSNEQKPQGSPADLCEMNTNANHRLSMDGCPALVQDSAAPLELSISSDTNEKEFYSMEVHNGGIDDVSDGILSFCSNFPNRENTLHIKKVHYSSDFDSPMGSIWVSDFSVECDASNNHGSKKMVKMLSYKRFKSFLSRVGDVGSPLTRRVSRAQDGCSTPEYESQPSSPWISSLGPSNVVNKSSRAPKIKITSLTKLKSIMVNGIVKVKVRIHKRGGAYKETEIWSPTLATYLYNQQRKDNMSTSSDNDEDDSRSFRLHLDRMILSSTRGQLNPYSHSQFVDEGASEAHRR